MEDHRSIGEVNQLGRGQVGEGYLDEDQLDKAISTKLMMTLSTTNDRQLHQRVYKSKCLVLLAPLKLQKIGK